MCDWLNKMCPSDWQPFAVTSLHSWNVKNFKPSDLHRTNWSNTSRCYLAIKTGASANSCPTGPAGINLNDTNFTICAHSLSCSWRMVSFCLKWTSKVSLCCREPTPQKRSCHSPAQGAGKKENSGLLAEDLLFKIIWIIYLTEYKIGNVHYLNKKSYLFTLSACLLRSHSQRTDTRDRGHRWDVNSRPMINHCQEHFLSKFLWVYI